MTFYIENETDAEFAFDYRKVAENVIRKVVETEKCPYETEVNVLITDNEGIRQFNKDYRGIDRETDVLSFPNLDFEKEGEFVISKDREADYLNPETGEMILGDIIVSADRVREQAKAYGHSEKREFAFLVAHSMLHLCGYDHMEEKEAGRMEEKQEKVLQALGITRE